MNRKTVISWCLYDVGATAFATVIMAVVLPGYYHRIATTELSATRALSYWGYGSSMALFFSALATPFLGTWSDQRIVKKKCIAFFALLGALASAGLATVGNGQWLRALTLLIVGTVAMSLTAVCYDAMLPSLAPRKQLDLISTVSYATGYLGGGVLLALDLWLLYRYGASAVPWVFLSVALWWIVFTIPLLLWVPEATPSITTDHPLGDTIATLKQSWSELKKFPEALRFLVAFWLYNDGIGTVIRMAALFGTAIGIDTWQLMCAMLVTQFVGVPCAVACGWLAQKIGSRRVLHLTLWCYVAITLSALVMTKSWHFWAMAVAVGTVQGGSQAISRSLFASMLPPGRSGHFFGLYNVSSKFAGIIGPALSGLAVALTGSFRSSIAVVALSFLAGIAVLRGVDVEAGRRRVVSS